MRAKKSLIGLAKSEELKTNKVEDIRDFFKRWRKELDSQWRLLFQDLATIEVDNDGWIYFGGKDTDGSWRIGRSGNDWNAERRESGTYVAKGAMTA